MSIISSDISYYGFFRKDKGLESLPCWIFRQVSHASKFPFFRSFSSLCLDLRMMFEPLAPLEFKPPIVRREFSGYNGIALSTSLFEKDPPPKPKSFETPLERRQKSRAKTLQLHKEKVEILVNDWDPHSNTKATE